MKGREALYRRTIRVLVLSQTLAGAGLAAGMTVGALLAEEMVGSTGSAGVPAALLTLGSAIAATGVGRLSQRSGRRPGLAAGYGIGALGSAGVVLAAAVDSVGLLFLSLVLYGSGTATNLQARYAGADLAAVDRRGRAISAVLVATTLGAVVGPNLVEPTGRLAGALGIPELAGPFILATAAYALAAVAVLMLLRPDPLLTARAAERQIHPPVADDDSVATAGTIRLAAAAMVLSTLVMVAVMTMTPIHMRDHGHSLGAAGLVISVHIAAMYLPSLLTGALVDRVGRRPVIAASGVTLAGSGCTRRDRPGGFDAAADAGPRVTRSGLELRARGRHGADHRRRPGQPTRPDARLRRRGRRALGCHRRDGERRRRRCHQLRGPVAHRWTARPRAPALAGRNL